MMCSPDLSLEKPLTMMLLTEMFGKCTTKREKKQSLCVLVLSVQHVLFL